METRRWTNPSQPQTLQIAVFLLYANAVFGLIGLGVNPYFFVGAVGYLALVGFAVSGFGIANEKRWGYLVGAGLAVGEVALWLVVVGPIDLITGGGIIGFAFSVALAALLLHPQSRDYQRIWFS